MVKLPDSIEQDREYLAQEADGFTPQMLKRLKRLDRGFQHTVDELDGEVIKVPTRRSWLWKLIPGIKHVLSYEGALEEYTLAKAYFGTYIPHTDVEPTADGLYIEEQVELHNIQPIRKRDMRKPAVRSEFMKILQRNALLIAHEGKSITFLGMKGAIPGIIGFPKITNVEMTNEGVRVVDYDLCDLSERGQRRTYRYNRNSVLNFFPRGSEEREQAAQLLPPLYKIPRRR